MSRDPDPADVTADDELIEHLSKDGAPPRTDDPVEWTVAGWRDGERDGR